MNEDRILTIHFIDGTKLAFDFPEQGPNAAARQIKLQDFFAGQHMVVESDEGLLIFPVANIKYIALRGSTSALLAGAGLPKSAIKGALLRG